MGAGRAVLCGAPAARRTEQPGTRAAPGGQPAREARPGRRSPPLFDFPASGDEARASRAEGATCTPTQPLGFRNQHLESPRDRFWRAGVGNAVASHSMSDKPGVLQPSKSKPTPAVPQPIAQPRAPTLNGRGAPAPNGVGRGGARDGRGDIFAGRGAFGREPSEDPDADRPRRQRPTDIDGGRPPAAIFPTVCERARGRPRVAPNPPPSLTTRIPLHIPQTRRPGNSRCALRARPRDQPSLPATCQVKNPPRSRNPGGGAARPG